jgi:O-antigen/teichoic acid export membrane protein
LLGEVAGALTLPLAWFLIAEFGLVGAGVSVLVLSATSCSVYVLRARKLGVRFTSDNVRLSAALLLFLIVLAMIFALNLWAGIVLGTIVAAAVVWRSFGELRAILAR